MAENTYTTIHCMYCDQPIEARLESFENLRQFYVDTNHECIVSYEDITQH